MLTAATSFDFWYCSSDVHADFVPSFRPKPLFQYFKSVTAGNETGNSVEARWLASIIQTGLPRSCSDNSDDTGECRWRLWGGADSHLTNHSLVSRPQLFTLRRQCLPIIDLTPLFGQLTPSPCVQCLSTCNENSGGGDEMEILYIYLKWEQGRAGG